MDPSTDDARQRDLWSSRAAHPEGDLDFARRGGAGAFIAD